MMGKSSREFKTTVQGDASVLFLELPFDVREEFGRARLPVLITINGYSYRSTVAVYGGKYMVPVRREHRAGAGLEAGDSVSVSLEPDTEPRTVETPEELAELLRKNASASAAWDALSYTNKKEQVGAILEAKKPETRARRVQKTMESLNRKR